MKDANEAPADAEKKVAKAAEKAPEPIDPAVQLKRNVTLLEKAVSSKEIRLAARALRQTTMIRKKLDEAKLGVFVKATLPESSVARAVLLEALSAAGDMEVEVAAKEPAVKEVVPEIEVYASLVVIMYLIDSNQHDQARTVADATVSFLDGYNRRTMDLLASRVYYYYSWSYECTDSLENIRSKLLALHRTATLRHDDAGQEMLLNLLLRNYLHYNLYDAAEKLRSKSELPEQRSNQQYCRYLYYLGRIRAVQLEYTDAKDCLQQAARKAPTSATGFRITVYKWTAVVRMLLGEIPERTMFREKGMQNALKPYFDITQAVRIGDLVLFKQLMEKYAEVLTKDKTLNLIARLRRNVIRTGLRRINLAYSRISLEDVAKKLGLGLTDDAECLVAKAIRDGGVDATLDHTSRTMQSKEMVDIYSTQEPQLAFHSRISFCLDTYNEALKAMRYPPDAHKKGLESAEARKERLQQEQELAKHIAEEEDDDF